MSALNSKQHNPSVPRKRKHQAEIERKLAELDHDPAVVNLLSKYANLGTQSTYLDELALYLRWLNGRGILQTPSQLITDNLSCIFKSDPTDVITKARHTNWLSEYINTVLYRREESEAKRKLASAAVRMFYQRNNSPLWGDYRVTETPVLETPSARPKALYAEDIRLVLSTLDMRIRTPLLISWQSSIEIGRVLSLEGRIPTTGEVPTPIELAGRKSHRLAYRTFVGNDSILALRALGKRPYASYDTIRMSFRSAAAHLAEKGLLKNPDVRAWRAHNLRHSFETGLAHAGVTKEVRGYFMGHLHDIQWVYNHRDEVHPEDLVKEYQKGEPAVSLNPTRAVIQEEFYDREKTFMTEINRLHRLYDELKLEVKEARSMSPSQTAIG
jgi:integrase